MDGALLDSVIRKMGRCVVLFSGGRDSEVLLRFAHSLLGSRRVVPVTADSPLLAGFYRERAAAVCRELGIAPVFITLDPLSDPVFVVNGEDRCYRCKRMIYTSAVRMAGSLNAGAVADGTHAGDLSEDRPGLRAAGELGVRHPFVEANMDADDIGKLALRLGMRPETVPPDSCLATRIPGGRKITWNLLKAVEAVEAPLRPLAGGRLRARVAEDRLILEFEDSDRNIVFPLLERLRSIAADAGFRLEMPESSGHSPSR